MKKFFLFVALLCATLNACAGGDGVTYTSWGNGLELVTGEWIDYPVYGLRQKGVEVVPTRSNLVVCEELNVAVFYRTHASGPLSVYGWLYLDVYDLSTGCRVAEDKIQLKAGDARMTYPDEIDKYVSVAFQPRKLGGQTVYAVHWIDKTKGRYVENDLIILGLQNGKLCKYVSCLKPVMI